LYSGHEVAIWAMNSSRLVHEPPQVMVAEALLRISASSSQDAWAGVNGDATNHDMTE
jgi:hypothetical protein